MYKVFILWTTEPEQPNCEIGSMERTKIVIVSNSRLGKLVNCYRKHRRKPRENTVGGSKSGKKFQFWELAALGITQIMLMPLTSVGLFGKKIVSIFSKRRTEKLISDVWNRNTLNFVQLFFQDRNFNKFQFCKAKIQKRCNFWKSHLELLK